MTSSALCSNVLPVFKSLIATATWPLCASISGLSWSASSSARNGNATRQQATNARRRRRDMDAPSRSLLPEGSSRMTNGFSIEKVQLGKRDLQEPHARAVFFREHGPAAIDFHAVGDVA